MDICEHCGRLFLKGRHELLLVEVEDFYGIWHEWLCSTCVDDLAQLISDDRSTVVRFAVFDWDFSNLRPPRAS